MRKNTDQKNSAFEHFSRSKKLEKLANNQCIKQLQFNSKENNDDHVLKVTK